MNHVFYNPSFTRLKGTLFYLFTLSSLLLLFACENNSNSSNENVFSIQCEASPTEKEIKEKNHAHKISESDSLNVEMLGKLVTNEYHSAPSSIFLSGKTKYSFVTQIDDIQIDEFFRISIWRKDASGESGLAVRGEPIEVFFKWNKRSIEKGKNGWEKIQIEFEVPPAINYIKFYATLAGSDSAYFDDLTIERFPRKKYPAFKDEKKIQLYFTDKKMNAFELERVKAFEEGVHFSSDDWKKGILSDGNDVIPIKARLKGDWLDHLKGRKWSFRIKIRNNEVFKRLRTFSLQTPLSRNYLHEYLVHQLFTQEDVLTSRYDFIPLYLNGESMGIYSLEEHFSKQMIEFNLRREGPILKFDENPFWEMLALTVGIGKQKYQHMPHYETSRIIAFELSKILADPKLKAQFDIAQGILYQHKYQKAPVEELFNIDQLARYWALIDISNGKHGIAWHNQRYYYNPVLCKLEPINYDNYNGQHDDQKRAFPQASLIKKETIKVADEMINAAIFTSEEFIEKYIFYLGKYTKPSFLKSFIDSKKEAIDSYLPLINEEFPEVDINMNFLLKHGKELRRTIPSLKKKLESGFFKNADLKYKPTQVTDLKNESILRSFLNTYYHSLSSDQAGKAQILVENYNGIPLELIGLTNKENKFIYRFPPGIRLELFDESADTINRTVPYFKNASHIVFKSLESNNEIYTELTPWEKNTSLSPYQQLLRSSNADASQLFLEQNDSLILKAGNYSLKNKILIPKGKTVVFEADANLDMIEEASIISYSPVYFNGTEEKPISIHSSDYTANGFTVLQAEKRSIVNHTTFNGLNTLNYKGWVLTGAVNFYESDVAIKHTTFENNQCEDALNIVRSDFWVSNSKFFNIYADAFDSDFCTGLLENSTFLKVGNDAIDFSTSQIKIKKCDIRNISDKGISGGEASTLEVESCIIEACNIGIASKDLSNVMVSNVSIKSCNYGFVALKKKPEYGAANIECRNVELIDCKTNHLIEKESILSLDNRKIEGVKKNVSALFY